MSDNQTESKPPIAIEHSETVYRGHDNAGFTVRRMDAVNGSTGWRGQFHVVTVKDNRTAVVIIPVRHSHDGVDRILIGRHWRVATGEWSWELPRGMGEHDETVLVTALRELMEETGIHADCSDAHELCTMYADTGILSNPIRVVRIDLPDSTEPSSEHDWELTDMKWVTLSELHDAIANGLIDDGITLSALIVYSSMGMDSI